MESERYGSRYHRGPYQKHKLPSWDDNSAEFDSIAFGIRVREARRKLGMTQEELAASINMTQHNLSGIERGIRTCSFDYLVKLSEALCVSSDYLLTGDTIMSEEPQTVICQIAKILLEVSKKL